jgi:hypothetical protein
MIINEISFSQNEISFDHISKFNSS